MLFFPLPGTYAIVELDVERTLQTLDDPIANAAGGEIKTTKSIVYLDMILRLPFPEDETFKYMAYLIGPGLRPENPKLCITPDMCIPIYPNTQHSVEDREPLRSDPPFPFGNCYHWFGPDMWLDLRIVNDGRDYSAGARTMLPPDQHVKMVGIQGRDIWRSICTQKERDDLSDAGAVPLGAALQVTQASQPTQTRSPSLARSEPASTSPTEPLRKEAGLSESHGGSDCGCEGEQHHQCDCCGAYEEGDSVSASEDGEEDAQRFSVYPSSEGSFHSAQSLDEIDIFGLDGDDRDDLLPIVKISLDLGAHFEGEEAPDPMAFMRQRDELVQIIKESKARAKQARNAAALYSAAESSSVNSECVAITELPEPCNTAPPVREEGAGSSSTHGSMETQQQPKDASFWSTPVSESTSIFRIGRLD